jgi:hypothetical protein
MGCIASAPEQPPFHCTCHMLSGIFIVAFHLVFLTLNCVLGPKYNKEPTRWCASFLSLFCDRSVKVLPAPCLVIGLLEVLVKPVLVKRIFVRHNKHAKRCNSCCCCCCCCCRCWWWWWLIVQFPLVKDDTFAGFVLDPEKSGLEGWALSTGLSLDSRTVMVKLGNFGSDVAGYDCLFYAGASDALIRSVQLVDCISLICSLV